MSAPDLPAAPAAAGTSRWRKIAIEVLRIEATAIEGLLDQLDESFDRAVERLEACRGRIVCTGMGKSGHVMKKVAATLSSTGSPALFVHPAEAIHGDLGMIVQGDVVLAASFSGTTTELLEMRPLLRARQVPLIAITANPESPLARTADIHLSARIDKEACPLNLAPTASTTATLALGDALAMTLAEARGFTHDDFAHLHPGGQLGRRLRPIEALMHTGEATPRVDAEAPLREAIYEMSNKGLGITAVVDSSGRLLGVISDGDLRRLLAHPDADRRNLMAQPARSCMHSEPRTIGREARSQDALQLMEEHRITTLFVVDSSGLLEGAVHIHDLWGNRPRG